jgi:hypothetical protein
LDAWPPHEVAGVADELLCETIAERLQLDYNRVGEQHMAEPTREELLARIAELEKQTGTRKRGELEFKVSEKGAVSVYGLGRFPVTLYYEQWLRILDAADRLRTFLEENKEKLKLKSGG